MRERVIVKVCTEMERELLAPHVEAMRRFWRLVEASAPEPGCGFDPDLMCWYQEREIATAPEGGEV